VLLVLLNILLKHLVVVCLALLLLFFVDERRQEQAVPLDFLPILFTFTVVLILFVLVHFGEFGV